MMRTQQEYKTSLFAIALAAMASASIAEPMIQLESTFVGDKEQPSVSYFMPWKPPEGPEKLYRPIDSISGNVLEPIDRKVLMRNMHFYEQMSLEQKAEQSN